VELRAVEKKKPKGMEIQKRHFRKRSREVEMATFLEQPQESEKSQIAIRLATNFTALPKA
jgi:hypothetical protein